MPEEKPHQELTAADGIHVIQAVDVVESELATVAAAFSAEGDTAIGKVARVLGEDETTAFYVWRGGLDPWVPLAAAAAPAGGGWQTYCDFNFSQMDNQSFPADGDVTIDGVTLQAGNVANGAQSAAIVNGDGFKFVATSSTNTYWYGSGHAAAYLGVDLDRIPGFLLETSEVRIFAECYLTVGTANYATACFGIGKRLNFSSTDFSPMIRQYYDSGVVWRGVFMPFNATEEGQAFAASGPASVAYNVGMVHFKSPHESIAWYAKQWAGLDTAPNADVFDDQGSFTLFAKRVEAISASAAPRLKQADKPMAMICGQNGNTSGNTVSTFKRLRIEYKV